MGKTSCFRAAGLIGLICLLFATLWGSQSSSQKLEDFLALFKKSIETKDLPAFCDAFSPAIRETEKEALLSRLNSLGMETILAHLASKVKPKENENRVAFQVLFQNAYSAMIEMWVLRISQVDNRWQIQKKDITASITNLYKIQIPSERVERVEEIDIEHVDIRLTFRNALVFYSNVPNLDTAVLVIGRGRLNFSPSDRIERQQLRLLYKKDVLNDELEYAYIRCSNAFVQKNIRITRRPGPGEPRVSPAERNRAASLFAKSYSRSFTIENSLTGEMLSFLPQGDEAVFEFKGRSVGELTYIYYPFASEEINLYDRTKDRLINIYSPQVDEKKKRLFVTFGQKIDIKKYQIELNFNPRPSFLSAKARIEVQAKVGQLNFMKLKFAPELNILRINDEEGRELFYTQDRFRKTLYVYFVTPLEEDDSTSIEVYYRGTLVPPSSITDVIAGPGISEPYVYVAPRFETYLFSQAALWYPCPTDEEYFQARLRIIVPPEYQCVSNGQLLEQGKLNGIEDVAEIDKTGNTYSVFETRSPVKYLSFLVGKLNKYQEARASVPVQVYFTPDSRGLKKGFIEDAKNIIEFYEKCFGPFPFEKLSIVQRTWSNAGGHSPASFVVLNELPWIGDKGTTINVNSPVDLSRWKEYFLAHEIAHQYWGQGVTWATYHDQWISEGLAQYAAALYLRNKYSDTAFSGVLKKFSQSTAKKAKWGPISLGSRLSYTNYEAYQAIIYNKTALVLEMLNNLLGEETFFTGLREFFRIYQFRSANTQNFFKTMEQVSGKDLSGFFQNWFFSSDLPEVRVTHAVEKKEGGFLLTFKVSQPKEVFVFPLRLQWIENGAKVIKKVVVDAKTKQFEFQRTVKPESIKVNPDKAVPGTFT